jgi:CcmD family protein
MMDVVPDSTAAPENSAVAASQPVAPAPASSAQTTDDRSTAFRPVEGGPQLQSGEKLLVEAYAAIWVILFALVLFSWRRQRRLDDRMVALEGAIEKARREEGSSAGEGDA